MKFMKGVFGEFYKFIRNEHECKILLIIWPFKMDFITLKMRIISVRKSIVDTVIVIVTCMR